jgi:hypothetical protein
VSQRPHTNADVVLFAGFALDARATSTLGERRTGRDGPDQVANGALCNGSAVHVLLEVGDPCANFAHAGHRLFRNGSGYCAEVRLESLSVFRWSYDEDGRVGADGYTIVSPYGSEEGIAYGEGRGTATGRIGGTVVWSNYPRRRTDGRMLPNVRGLITTQDGASILFEFRGRTIFEGDEPGRQNLVGWFESDHESYRWLNDLVCIAEGGISATGPDMVINVYAGIHEM